MSSQAEGMGMERMNDDRRNKPDFSGGDIDDLIRIGNNNTTLPNRILASMNWSSHNSVTQRLLFVKFTREILATHSLTANCLLYLQNYHQHFLIKTNH